MQHVVISAQVNRHLGQSGDVYLNIINKNNWMYQKFAKT